MKLFGTSPGAALTSLPGSELSVITSLNELKSSIQTILVALTITFFYYYFTLCLFISTVHRRQAGDK